MSRVETANGDVNHFARVIQAELEPCIHSEVFVQTERSSPIIAIVKDLTHFLKVISAEMKMIH